MARDRILVIDDEQDMLENCRRILERLGYEPLLEWDAVKAVARFEQESPVMTLTDLRMPKMDGL
ncbi:MAG: response regulator, partial [candidate division NC10 bacterium]|nr:response regulator [candidate division NC10 bacterium]